MDKFKACIALLRMLVIPRRVIRPTNLLERLFFEERRRREFVPSAFGEQPVLELVFGAMTHVAERRRSILLTELRCRQIAAVRKSLDAEYETANTPSATSYKVHSLIEIPTAPRRRLHLRDSCLD